MQDDLAVYLARQARELGLDALTVDDTGPETLRDFARVVLGELAALGLLRGEEEVGCWASPRPGGH